MTMEWETCSKLIRYAYRLGGNTRDMARLTGLPHDDVVTALMSPPAEPRREPEPASFVCPAGHRHSGNSRSTCDQCELLRRVL